ncbi:SphA family protein [Desulfosarcina variabilis]|uniref:SphA family protein n=1 Tax=Desulfosarcina variabilis TaxID=2300 RepID=UPI003AFB6C94
MGSHYPFGGEGVTAGSAPPPGFHYRGYLTFTNPTKYKDDNGDALPVDVNVDVVATVHRFLHVTKFQILGANYAYEVVVPIVEKDVTFGALSDSKSLSLGDVFFEPLALAWNRPRWDATFTLGVYAPTGEYDSTKLASPGLGYWSGMLTLGGTVFFDADRTLSLSAMTRTLMHTEQDETKVTPGSEFVVEYGLGKEIGINDKLSIRPGICGSAYWQIEDDSDDGPATVADERKEAFSLGAEINFFWLPPKLFQLNVRVLREFGAKNTTQGSQVCLTLTKSW